MGSWRSETIFFSSNRGCVTNLFENPHHGPQLRAMGLTPNNAFGSVFNFLFRLKPEACYGECRRLEALLLKAGQQVASDAQIK